MKPDLATTPSAATPDFCRAVLASLTEAVFVVDPATGRIAMANAAVGDLFGISPEELVGEPARRLYGSDEDYELFARRVRESLTVDRTLRTELTLQRADGETFVAEVTTSVIDPEDRRKGVVSVLRDVSALKEAQAEIERQRDRFLELFRISPVAMALSDVDTSTFVEVNDRWCEVTGFDRDEMIGRSTLDIGLWDDLDVRSRLREVLASDGRADNVRTEIRRRDGSLRVVFGSIVLIELAGRKLWFSTVHDVTERARLEEERARMLERRGTLDRLGAIGELAGGVAHDLNNVLLPILVNVDLSLPDASDELRSRLEEVREAALRGRGLTRKLLAFGRRQRVQKEPTDLGDVLRSAEPILRRLVPETISVELSMRSSLPLVDADPAFIEQVLANLVTNARDALGDGGRIAISTEVADVPAEGHRFGDTSRDGLHVYVVIRDDGPGIAPEVMERMFEPFFSTKQDSSATGLGLSSALGIVDQHGGHIIVETEVGEGATFKVGLPATAGAVERSGGRTPSVGNHPDRSAGAGRTVLVVEDDEAVRRVTARVLRSYGFEVVEAADGSAAIEVLGSRSDEIDVIISDMVMPGMTGLELRDAAGETAPGIPVLLVSGYSSAVLAEHGVHGDTVRVLEKPFTPARLVRAVVDTLGDAGAR